MHESKGRFKVMVLCGCRLPPVSAGIMRQFALLKVIQGLLLPCPDMPLSRTGAFTLRGSGRIIEKV